MDEHWRFLQIRWNPKQSEREKENKTEKIRNLSKWEGTRSGTALRKVQIDRKMILIYNKYHIWNKPEINFLQKMERSPGNSFANASNSSVKPKLALQTSFLISKKLKPSPNSNNKDYWASSSADYAMRTAVLGFTYVIIMTTTILTSTLTLSLKNTTESQKIWNSSMTGISLKGSTCWRKFIHHLKTCQCGQE